ncbi:hypothetical protein Bca52824_044808 [Brassica carinata]|uniref:Protein kinase domain-containing protein n=2 Tax=Brassica TaxID=3705 RepID=A0A8X7RH20_BRACI|nr:hypothetical protein Bca52824_044808 [Brassica carinata]
MNEKRRSTVSSILKMRSLMAFVVLLSFGSCFSLKEEGLDKDRLEKDLWSDEDSAILKAVGFHRKALVPREPLTYDNLPSRRNSREATPAAATITPPSSPQPSHKNVSTHSSTASDPEPTQDVSTSPPHPPPPPPTSAPHENSPTLRTSSSSSSVVVPVVLACVGCVVLVLLVATGVFYFKNKVGKSVNPWRTGLSGQLQKVFVTGIPTLKRSEIEAACEDFSNVIGSCPIGKLFKGTLSSGVEIAVASIDTTCANDWKEITEIQFRKKIEMLSKINHKNFVNLLGYCEEKEPFTRILIFEYAPNGSLFEHLHSKESEHLDWGMRLRITMGLAYCLDHMHQLNPPIAHTNLVSSSLHLTEDYAVKLADFTFGPSETETCSNANKDTYLNPEDNVYSFGLLLFEMITGKLVDSVNKPDSVDTGLVDFLRGVSLANMVDPALESYDDKIDNIGEVIKSCIRTDPKERLTMKEVTGWLREITGISPSDATPTLSPLWWAELEVLSMAKAVGFHRKALVPPSDPEPTQDVSTSPPHPPPPPPTSAPHENSPTLRTSSSSSSVVVPVVLACVGCVVLVLLVATGVFYFKNKVGKSVNPWRTGLSGQLQKVFVTGIPTLKRSEIEAACEDFSNVIGSCPIGKLFKGTLSSGVEIAVASIDTTCANDWKEITEIQFRKKIEMLSKINHKNFVNLLGYCEEKEPFTRILIFEYAPNGSLFEHLHSKESEHLDWGMRLRITMGLAYCLDHMHQLNPPIAHTNLVSSSLHLTEDYAVKLADFTFGPSETETCSNANKDTYLNPEDNVYSFGLLLFEMITGKLVDSVNKPDSVDTGLVDFLRGVSLANMVDPALESYDDKIDNIGEVIKSCIRTDPKERLTMKEVTGWLREITGISPSDATPTLSPLWWAELEVLSMA